jgi:hypothetical protein
VLFSARSECTQRPGPPKDTPPLLTPYARNTHILGEIPEVYDT